MNHLEVVAVLLRVLCGADPDVPIAIDLCSEDTEENVSTFNKAAGRHGIRLGLVDAERCDVDGRKGNALTVVFIKVDEAVSLEMRTGDGTRVKRRIPWLTDSREPIEKTIEKKQQVSLSLLLRSLLHEIDFVPPSLPGSGPDESEPVKPGGAGPGSTAVSEKERNGKYQDEMAIAVFSGYQYWHKDVAGFLAAVEIAKPFSQVISLAVGVGFLSADDEAALSRPLRLERVRAWLSGEFELWEQGGFRVDDCLRLSGQMSTLKRLDVPESKARVFLDFLVGNGLKASYSPTGWLSLFVMPGADLIPTARLVRVAEGPEERFGYFEFFVNGGFSIHF